MKIVDKLKKYLGEMDANHDDFFELGNLKRQLDALKKQQKGIKDKINDINAYGGRVHETELEFENIKHKIKKVEDKIRYLKK